MADLSLRVFKYFERHFLTPILEELMTFSVPARLINQSKCALITCHDDSHQSQANAQQSLSNFINEKRPQPPSSHSFKPTCTLALGTNPESKPHVILAVKTLFV